MNRFRSKKKAAAKEANEAAGRASNDSEIPPIPNLKTSKTFKRGKKTVPVVEPKVELDLSTALPSSDDFRTSLLMNGLSARFSMLREQDDPNSKLGKASDDSVLFPKRHSRLDNFTNFGPNGLSDIDEVASIRGSNQFFRPPFANTNSYHSTDGYGTDDDSTNGSSIMSRSKPGEGNNLFGGRQKVYHIPLRATGESGGKRSGMGGRARYDDDVSQSAFQRFKEQERQQREHDEEQASLAEDAAQTARSSSPPLSGYNRNRETSSTTSSGPTNTRSSTAATSISSQAASPSFSNVSAAPSANGPTAASGSERSTAAASSGLERTFTKTRRLYETGLEKNLHEQQHSAMNRIDSLTRQQNIRSQTPPLTLSSPPSVSNLSERFERHEISSKPSQASLRAVSPPPSASVIGTFEFGIKSPASTPQSPFGEPPLSPPMSEGDDALSSNVDAKDRGKATALGAFNKPAQPYDDTKYSERQMQMKAIRETPQKTGQFQQVPPVAGRNRAESNATTNSSRSRSTSSAQRQPFVPRSRIPESRSAESRTPMSSPPSQAAPPPGRSMNFTLDTQGSHRGMNDMRIAEEQPVSTETSAELSPEFQHPAHRPGQRLWADFSHSDSEQDSPNPSILLSQADARKGSAGPPVDSPTLGPTLGPTAGLSGMVRQHMRSDSNASSFFGAPSPGLTSKLPADPWDLEDSSNGKVGEQHSPGRKLKGVNYFSAAPPPLSIKSAKVEPVILDEEIARPPALAVRSPNIESSRVEDVAKPGIENDVPARHTRDGSTETQKESANFANELAQRRRRVQENLKSFAGSDSRSNSPVPDLDLTKEIGKLKSNPLGILKAKSSRESLVNMQVKSRRMLGLGNTTISSSSSPNLQAFDDDMWQKEEEEMLRDLPKSPNSTSPGKDFRKARREERKAALSERNLGKESDGERLESEAQIAERQRKFSEDREWHPAQQSQPNQGGQKQEANERFVRKASQESKNSAGSSAQSRPSSRAARDRSSSATSGRSKSRNGQYRDDLAKAMAEGLGSSTRANYEEESSRIPVRPPITPIMASQSTFMSPPRKNSSSRSRSNSRAAPPIPVAGYFDNHSLHPLQTGDISNIGLSPRPSPVTPFSVNSTPSLTPNGSGTNTPSTQPPAFPMQNRILARKKTINKADISEPTLVSTTSQIDTVNLPPGASLKNGVETAPPVPPINPRRRQTRIQTMVGVFTSNKSSDSVPTMPSHSTQQSPSPTEDQSTFSADEGDEKKPRKLRKSSSEGQNLHARAKQVANAQPSPAMPVGEQGGMF